MRHASSQPAHGFDSLGMMKLLLQTPPVRDIARVHHHASHAGKTREIARGRFYGAERTVLVAKPILQRHRSVTLASRSLHTRPIVGVHKIEDVLTNQLLGI